MAKRSSPAVDFLPASPETKLRPLDSSRLDHRRVKKRTEVDAYQREIQSVRDQAATQVKAADASARQQIAKFRSEYPTQLQFDYELDHKAVREPFLVSAIFHDDRFTYIKCAASEKPAIYEIKDGKPNLINFDLDNGMYIVPKIMDAGYLAIGKKKVSFTRHPQQ